MVGGERRLGGRAEFAIGSTGRGHTSGDQRRLKGRDVGAVGPLAEPDDCLDMRWRLDRNWRSRDRRRKRRKRQPCDGGDTKSTREKSSTRILSRDVTIRVAPERRIFLHDAVVGSSAEILQPSTLSLDKRSRQLDLVLIVLPPPDCLESDPEAREVSHLVDWKTTSSRSAGHDITKIMGDLVRC